MTTAPTGGLPTGANALRAGVYDRVSRDTSGRGRSVVEQHDDNTAAALTEGWRIVCTDPDDAAAAERGNAELGTAAPSGHRDSSISEALGIDHEHLHEERGHQVARIVGKGARHDQIPLPPLVQHAIALQDRTTGPLLLDGYGARMGRGTASCIVARLGRLAGVGHVSPHMLRVTCASASCCA